MVFFRAMLAWIGKILTAITPFKKGVGLSPFVRWLIWIVLDVTVLAILYLINSRWESLTAWLPDLGPSLKPWWLPALGQLVIFLVIGLVAGFLASLVVGGGGYLLADRESV